MKSKMTVKDAVVMLVLTSLIAVGSVMITDQRVEAKPRASMACSNTDCDGPKKCEFKLGDQCKIPAEGGSCTVTECKVE